MLFRGNKLSLLLLFRSQKQLQMKSWSSACRSIEERKECFPKLTDLVAFLDTCESLCEFIFFSIVLWENALKLIFFSATHVSKNILLISTYLIYHNQYNYIDYIQNIPFCIYSKIFKICQKLLFVCLG